MSATDQPHDVYWIYDDQDRLIYIGYAANASERIRSHEALRLQSTVSDEICHRAARYEFRRYQTKSAARAIEAYAIEVEAPYLNRQHNRTRFAKSGRLHVPIQGIPTLPALTPSERSRGAIPGLLERLQCAERRAAA